jgi:hypothetical protein
MLLCCACVGVLALKARNAMDAIAGKLFVLTIPSSCIVQALPIKVIEVGKSLTTARHRKFIG